jgi:hypothetical protein
MGNTQQQPSRTCELVAGQVEAFQRSKQPDTVRDVAVNLQA